MATVTIPRPRGGMSAHLAVPEADAPAPGVVVVHDALGMTTDLRNQADWLAGAGFVALAPDLYYWGSRARCMFATIRAGVNREGQVFEDLDAARVWLAARDECTGRIGVIGFCVGGGIALLVAATHEYSASSVNYGSVPNDSMAMLADACPIVASYGGRDRTLAGAPAKLQEALAANGVPHDVKVYPEAGHGFLNNHVTGEVPAWALVAGKFASTGYHEPAAADARRRIVDFFSTHLAE